MFRKELYEKLNDISDTELIKIINMLSKSEQKTFYEIFNITSTKNINTTRSMNLINRIKILKNVTEFKKNLLNVFLGVPTEEIKSSIDSLNKEQKNTLLKEYSFTEGEVITDPLDKKDIKINKITIENLWRIITRRKIIFERINGIDFYSNFNTTPEKVNEVMTLLNKNDLEILKVKFGENFDKKEIIDLALEDNIRVYSKIIPFIISAIDKLNNGYVLVRIEDFYKDVDKEKLKKVVESLPRNEYERIVTFFGENLDKLVLIEEFKKERLVTRRANQFIVNKIKVRNIKPFYEIFKKHKFNDETIEEFMERVKSLITVDQMEYLKKKYGMDLKKTIKDGTYSPTESSYIFKVIKPYLDKRLEKMTKERNRKIKESLGILATDDEFLHSVNLLSIEEKNTIYDYCLQNVREKAYEENINKIKNKLETEISIQRNKKTGISLAVLNQINYLTETEEFKNLKETYSDNLALAILISINFPSLSISEISSLVKAKEKEIEKERMSYLLKIGSR